MGGKQGKEGMGGEEMERNGNGEGMKEEQEEEENEMGTVG